MRQAKHRIDGPGLAQSPRSRFLNCIDAARRHAAWRDRRKTGLIMHETPAAHICLPPFSRSLFMFLNIHVRYVVN
jgi:hypothetical protein